MKRTIISTIRLASMAFATLCAMFFVFEPAISFGGTSATNTFTESLTVTKEVAFATQASNVTLSPSIGGITGGSATGGTQFAITSNDTAGYTVTISAATSSGMVGVASSSNIITAYKPSATGVPDYTFTVRNPTGTAFGYTVDASTTSDLAPAFLTNGAACNTGSSDPGLSHCWLNASTTPVTIINRSTPTFSGSATSTLTFEAMINPNPNPIIPNDTYVATTTLTVNVN